MEIYNDEMSFEAYFCDEVDFPPPPADDVDYKVWYEELTARFGASKFSVTPRHDYIRWRGELNSDFRIREI
jgi:hypothetical protein